MICYVTAVPHNKGKRTCREGKKNLVARGEKSVGEKEPGRKEGVPQEGQVEVKGLATLRIQRNLTGFPPAYCRTVFSVWGVAKSIALKLILGMPSDLQGAAKSNTQILDNRIYAKSKQCSFRGCQALFGLRSICNTIGGFVERSGYWSGNRKKKIAKKKFQQSIFGVSRHINPWT